MLGSKCIRVLLGKITKRAAQGHSQKLFDITSEKYKITFFELSNRYFFPIWKSCLSPKCGKHMSKQKTQIMKPLLMANAVAHTVPVVTALLVITVLSEMLLTFGLDNKLRYPAAKQSFTCLKFSSKLSPYSPPEGAPSGAYFDYIGMKKSETPYKTPHSKLCPLLKQK